MLYVIMFYTVLQCRYNAKRVMLVEIVVNSCCQGFG